MDERDPKSPELARVLGATDGALITIGAVIGTGIFMTSGDVAAALPHAGLVMLVWALGGLLTLAGALSYAELGAMFPRAGGIYHFLKEAYGPLWGFLYGWTAFFVIMSGGIAAIAAGFAEYLASFFPALSPAHVLATIPIGPWSWTVSAGSLVASAAIVVLTAINHVGLKPGALFQNGLTVLKIGAILALVVFSLIVPSRAHVELLAPLPEIPLLSGLGIGMIAVLWAYDGWYGLTFAAGEIRDPQRNLPRGLIAGTLVIMALYLLANVAYLRGLSIEQLSHTTRAGETASVALFGAGAARIVTGAIVISILGCLAATILYSSRIYLPMAQDGVFFASMARVHPVYRTPHISLWAQSAWAIVLTLSGSFAQLFTYVVFASVLFQMATGAAVIVLRTTRPAAERPYRTLGYPLVPALFVIASLLLVVNTVVEKPTESVAGLGLVALGIPAYALWVRRRTRRAR